MNFRIIINFTGEKFANQEKSYIFAIQNEM